MNENRLSKLLQSPPDSRDFKYSAAVEALPRKVDLRSFAGQIEDQSSIGSCTANATCSALELMMQRAGKFEDLSRLFVYYETRLMENRVGQDGAVLRDALKAANNLGVPAEAVWPYDISKVDLKPSIDAYEDAKKRMLTRYEAVELMTIQNNLGYWEAINNLKAALAEGLPVVIAMAVNATIFQLKGPLSEQHYATRDDATMQAYPSIGNHAVSLVGYDDDAGYFIFENSWGSKWGDNGFGAISYRVIGGVILEAWVVRGFDGIEIVKPDPIPEPAPAPTPPAPEPIPPTPQPDPVPPAPVPPVPIPPPAPVPPPEPEPTPPAPPPQPAKKSNALPLVIGALVVAAFIFYHLTA